MAHNQPEARPAYRASPALDKLPEHLLQIIVETIYADTQRFVAPDKRAFFSVESFPPVPPEKATLSHFRLVCRLFSELALPYQFSIITTRFSEHGFQRLADISSCERVAKCAKRFVYLVPFFFVEGRDGLNEIFRRHRSRKISEADRDLLRSKKEQQQALVSSADDVKGLTEAFKAFSALQHVQLNSVLDQVLGNLNKYLKRRRRRGVDLDNLLQLKWKPACKQGLQSLGQALENSHSKCNKISIPAMDQEAASALCFTPAPKLSNFAQNLISLILQFATADVDRLTELSPYFKEFFSQAVNLEAVHIGFPLGQRLDLQLETVFHGITWPRLRALGLQAWRFTPDELSDIVSRHRKTLRGLRLRESLLKDGRWSDVLQMLRTEMQALDWVSLRWIDYASHFQTVQAATGFEVHDSDDDDDSNPDPDPDPDHEAFGMLPMDADSDDEVEEGDEDETAAESAEEPTDDIGSESDSNASQEGSGHNAETDQLDLPTLPDPAVSRSTRRSSLAADELVDDGIAVGGRKVTKAWEAWVLAEHSS